QVTAAGLRVKGGAHATGNAAFHPAATTGAPVAADPLSGLPTPTGLTSMGSVNLSGNSSAIICPGIYTAIKISGNAHLTLRAGIYVIAGGGFTVTGNASVTGTGILIYNGGSNFPSPGGTYGGLTLSGN